MLAAGLLTEDPVIGDDGGELAYRTSHPLLAEAAYSRLPELTRRRKHALVASATEQVLMAQLHSIGLDMLQAIGLSRDYARIAMQEPNPG